MPDLRFIGSAAAGAAVVGGLAWLIFLATGPSPSDDARDGTARAPNGAGATLARLEAELAAERLRNQALMDQIAFLEDEIEWLTPGDGDPAEETPDSSPLPDVATAPGSAPGSAKPDADAKTEGAADTGFDEAALLALGLRPDEIERLRERYEMAELDELYLRDQATRENWLRSKRYFRELRKGRRALRREMGDEDYDYMLYASGRNNRVELSHILTTSPAETHGLKDGDVLVSYNDRVVFDSRELQVATTTCEAGRLTSVEILRNGERERSYVPCGPLGVKLKNTRAAPTGN